MVGILAHARILFSNCLKVRDVTKDQCLIQGITPDMAIDARGRINRGTFPDNPLDDRMSLFKHKTLASLKVAVESRAKAVQSNPSQKERAKILMPVILA